MHEVNELLNILYDSGIGEVKINDYRGELGRITIPGCKTYIGIIGADKSGDVRRIHVFKDVGSKTIERLVEFGDGSLSNVIIERGLNNDNNLIRFSAETLPTDHPAVKLIGNVAINKEGLKRYRIALRKDSFSPWKAVMIIEFKHESSTWFMNQEERRVLDKVIDSIIEGPDGYFINTIFMRDYDLIGDLTIYCEIDYIANVTADMVEIIDGRRQYIIDTFAEHGV